MATHAPSITSKAPLAGERPVLPRSLWAATAIAPCETPRLEGEITVDVAIVGAGFAGLCAAITLAEGGRTVAVVDAAEPGWGASGRNNGQVIAGMKLDPDGLAAEFGAERGRRLADWAGAAPDAVFDMIARHEIACDPVREGWIQPAYTSKAMRTIESRCAQWQRLGAPVEMLAAADLPKMLGTPAFVGGWLDKRGGTIQPLSYARGLAAAAVGLGVRLFSHTPAVSMARESRGWSVRTPEGSVRAAQVFVATAGYADDLVHGLRRTMVPVRTAQVATRPLPEATRRAILPGRHGASDTRRLLTSFRLSPDGRLVMGGAWATAGLDDAPLLPHLHKAGAELFAHLGPLEWDYGWSGVFPVTTDHMPHLHESGDGLFCALGCNGRGIGLSTAMGKLVAERILGKVDLPLAPSPMRPVAFHAFRGLGVAAATIVKGVQDGIDRARTTPRTTP
jgi:glycine/D-amino acid oxidase-like deaminating enzyme